ncbi:replicative DNA helicase [Nocardiopsis gilva YIM 90087]|uniref:Replicative DNA helicase n=1 Tax=Nocardiopsis gilva YIM 90087 TaxID=1235441 RepID=A0A223S609_9ACTN|nr:replicative DNA helicase [Nocardiopsis gilva]ASU83556.1 replicative DNA helicase [Nocardiopsis gilva YIM 90087]
MSDAREMPWDLNAEQCVLEAMMLNRRAAEQIIDILQPRDFYRPAHQELFALLVELVTAGAEHGHVALAAQMRRAGSRIDPLYLAELDDKIPTAANGGYYAKIVADRAVQRRLVEVGTRIAHYGYDGVGDVTDLVSHARDAMDTVDTPVCDDTIATIGELFAPMVDELEKPEESGDAIELPYTDLQEVLGGLHPGQLMVIGARPSVGKTVVGVDIARHAAIRQGLRTVVFSLEMTKRELMHRIVSAEAQITITAIRNRSLRDAEWERMSAVQARFNESPLMLDDASNISLPHIRARLRHLARSRPVGLIVVDYLQLMDSPGRAENRQIEVAQMARGLKKLAGEFGAPVVLLSQLNRESTKRHDKKPILSDLRESGAVEQDSDIVVLLHRDDMHDRDSPRSGEIDLIVEKNRQGPRCTVTCAFQGHYSRVVDMAAG